MRDRKKAGLPMYWNARGKRVSLVERLESAEVGGVDHGMMPKPAEEKKLARRFPHFWAEVGQFRLDAGEQLSPEIQAAYVFGKTTEMARGS